MTSELPINGVNPYENHKGFKADECELRRTVTQRCGDYILGGFSCYCTGGHCEPSYKCESMRDSVKAQDALDLKMSLATQSP